MNVKYKKLSYLSNKDKDKLLREEINKQLKDVVPCVYASIALALFRNWNLEFEDISKLFAQSQEIWEEIGDDNMIRLCEEETGILLRGE